MTTRIHSFRYTTLEPTAHRTRCDRCRMYVENGTMFVMRVIYETDGVIDDLQPPWFLACLNCYSTEVEGRITGDDAVRAIRLDKRHVTADGHPLGVSTSGVWNEEP